MEKCQSHKHRDNGSFLSKEEVAISQDCISKSIPRNAKDYKLPEKIQIIKI